MFTGGKDGTVRMWQLTPDEPSLLRTLETTGKSILGISCSEDGSVVVAGCLYGGVFAWKLRDPDPHAIQLGKFEKGVLDVAISPDGRWVVAGAAYEPSRVWDLESPAPYATRKLVGHDNGTHVTRVVRSPNSRWLAVGSWSTGASVFDLVREDPFEEPILRFADMKSGIQDVAFSSDSESVMFDNEVISGLSSDRLNVTRQTLPIDTYCSAFFPDGGRAVTRAGNRLVLWDLDADALLPTAKRLIGKSPD